MMKLKFLFQPHQLRPSELRCGMVVTNAAIVPLSDASPKWVFTVIDVHHTLDAGTIHVQVTMRSEGTAGVVIAKVGDENDMPVWEVVRE